MSRRSLLEELANVGVKESRISRPLRMRMETKYGRNPYLEGIQMSERVHHKNEAPENHNGEHHHKNVVSPVSERKLVISASDIPWMSVFKDRRGNLYFVDPILLGFSTEYHLRLDGCLDFAYPIQQVFLNSRTRFLTLDTEFVKSHGGLYEGVPTMVH